MVKIPKAPSTLQRRSRILAFQCLGNNLNGPDLSATPRPDTKCSQLGGSLSVMHFESGSLWELRCWLYAGRRLQHRPWFPGLGAIPDDRSAFYAFEVGIETQVV